MADFLEPAAAAAGSCLAPGLSLFRRYLDDAAQQALAGEIELIVLQAPWFLPRMPRSGRAFSVKMTNCGSLGYPIRTVTAISQRIRLPAGLGLPSLCPF
jgi:alkylated DNA repair dioxygenase AlkB